MKKYFVLFFIFRIAVSFGQTPADDPNWQLVWSDDFNTLDLTKWRVYNNFDHYGEAEVYTTNNVSIENVSGNNNLVLEAKAEIYSCPPGAIGPFDCKKQYLEQAIGIFPGVYAYTSGAVETINDPTKPSPLSSDIDLQFGYYEARIKFPYGHGYWPAFWTFVADYVDPALKDVDASEIDIAEQLGRILQFRKYSPVLGDTITVNEESNTYLATNVHLGFCNSGGSSCPTNPNDYHCAGLPCNGEVSKLNVDFSLGYHTYAIEWSPTRIIWYFDNVAMRTMVNHGALNPAKIILGFGLSQGQLDGSTTFPAKMYVDYVNVYKLKQDCSGVINTCTYDFPDHDNKIKDEISIGGTGCVNSVASSSSTYLRASNFVELKGDFSVPVGATFFADANGDRECGATPPPNDNCGNIFNPCNYDFVGYDNGIKKQITLGEGSCIATISSGSTITLDATDSIELGPGFTIEPGADTDIEIVDCP